MIEIVGISGSLRKGSYNSSLLRAAAALAPEGTRVETASILGLPLYDGDVEEEAGVPQAVRVLADRIVRAHGLLLVTPEYNNSIPGVFKNAIDWLSRLPEEAGPLFRDRPVALMGASPGRMGTSLAQAAWLPVLRTLGTRPWFGGRLLVGSAHKVFDEGGTLVDDRVRTELKAFMAGFSEFVDRGR